jgi:hypothetical protein
MTRLPNRWRSVAQSRGYQGFFREKIRMRTSNFIWLIGIAAALANSTASIAQTTNPIFEKISKEGIVTADGSVATVPAPVMADGLSAADQKKAIDSISEGNKNFQTLTNKGVNAPYILKISDVKPAKGESKTIRLVEFYFVIHADMKRLEEESFLKGQTEEREKKEGEEEETKASGEEIKPEVLKSLGITVAEGENRPERYFQGAFPLFGRVRVEGVGHSYYTKSDASSIVASILIPDFAKDEKYAAKWIPLTRDEKTGKRVEGKPQSYAGAGAYTKATPLVEPKGAVFVEQHILFDEPKGWFNGANLLRSKLPIVIQDEIRLLRRRAMGEKPASTK